MPAKRSGSASCDGPTPLTADVLRLADQAELEALTLDVCSRNHLQRIVEQASLLEARKQPVPVDGEDGEDASEADGSGLEASDESMSDEGDDIGSEGDVAESEQEPLAESLIDDVFAELDATWQASGGAGHVAYPFSIEKGVLVGKTDARTSVYSFLLALSLYGKDAAKPSGARLFEELCREVAAVLLSGPLLPAQTFGFGFPRPSKTGFKKAVLKLIEFLGEGEGCQPNRDYAPYKDDALDIVACKPFLDGFPGKLVLFGQCATGNNWTTKMTELQPFDWCCEWFQDAATLKPIKALFVPHRLTTNFRRRAGNFGGLLLERSRIAYTSMHVPDDLKLKCGNWAADALKACASK